MEQLDSQYKLSWTCPVCHRTAAVPADTPRIFCCCGHEQLNGVRAGLGDHVASGLAKVGITKKRVGRLLGRPCKCRERQAWLNRQGRKVGIG